MSVLTTQLRCGLCALPLICVCASATPSEAADPPDAHVLLQGVANARLSMPPFRLTVHAHNRSKLGENVSTNIVLCDGIRRQWIVTSGFDDQTRTMFNDEHLFVYRPPNSCTIRNATDSAGGNYAFDPRILGITTSSQPMTTVERCLRITGAVQMEFIGQEDLDGKSTWHCRVLGENDQQRDYWIERSDDLQVLRYTYTYENLRKEANSTYSNSSFLPLPTVVELHDFVGDEERISTRIEILEMEKDTTIPEETWTLAGLDLPIGSTVTDVEKSLRIGYWNGRGLSELPPTPKQVVALQKEEDTATIWRWVLAANVFLVGVLLAIVALRQWRKAT